MTKLVSKRTYSREISLYTHRFSFFCSSFCSSNGCILGLHIV